jgi:hypothetical protein
MPATSESQRKLMCLAMSMKKGKTSPNVSAEAAKLCNEMTLKQLEDFCKSKVK